MSDFNENSFEKTERNYARLKVLSESMSGIPGLQSGAEVPLRLMPKGTQYKKGDIIVFYRDGVKIVHRVEYVYESNGETFYVTEGVNPNTNPIVDNKPVAGEDIIGLVDLSEEAFITLDEMFKNRFVPFYTAYGMPSSTQEKPLKYLSYFKRAQELVNFFSKGIKPQSLTDREARLWYLRQEYKMRDMLDHSLSLKLQAVQAFYLRNCLRSKARDLMMNQKLAEYLRRNDKNYNWDQMVQRTEDKGFKGSGIWREIIESSMRSRQEANDELGVSGWEVYNSWWRYFKIG
ncbi:MAG: signal peptidase I [Candidatus Odinarchaeota archaeon]